MTNSLVGNVSNKVTTRVESLDDLLKNDDQNNCYNNLRANCKTLLVWMRMF
jgi:hypothetical protein